MESRNRELLTRYLLGDLAGDEEERLEREYFVNEEMWNSVLALEDDLIDAYVRNALHQDRREQFQRFFLRSPRNRRRVELAMMLANPATKEPTPSGAKPHKPSHSFWSRLPSRVPEFPRVMRPAFFLAGIAIAALAILATMQNRHLRAELLLARSAQLGQESQRRAMAPPSGAKDAPVKLNAPAVSEADSLQVLSPGIPIVSILLTPGGARSTAPANGTPLLPLLSVPSTIVLGLDLEHDDSEPDGLEHGGHLHYTATLSTAEGKELQRFNGLKIQPVRHGGRAIMLWLSSQGLKKGDYVVRLFVQSTRSPAHFVDSYNFSLTK